jgi:putative ABC transport system permease protein
VKLLSWWLRRVAGEVLAGDIEGDIAESGGGRTRLLAIAAAVTTTRIFETIVSVFTGPHRFGRGVSDFRHAVRSLRRAPWYSFAVVLVIAVTGALTTAGFAIVDGVLFKRLAIPDPASLYATTGPGGAALSLADLDAWRRAAPEVRMALYGRDFPLGAIGAPPKPLMALTVEQSFFDVLGEQPAAGGWRLEDFQPAARTRVIISDRLWRQMFGGSRDVIGRSLEVAGAADHMRRPMGTFEIAGVLPADFVFPLNRSTPDVLLPMAVPPEKFGDRNSSAGRVLIRAASVPASLVPRLSAAFTGEVSSAHSDTGKFELALVPITRYLMLWQRDTLSSAFAACAVLMLLAIVNVAALSTLRGQQQAHELGVRRALGATKLDLLRLAMFDGAPLVLAGSILALTATPWIIAATVDRMSERIVLIKTPSIDWRVMIFWISLAALMSLVSSVVRALAVSPQTVASGIRADRGATRRARFGGVAVSVQVALGFTITIGGTLVAGSLWKLWQEPIGYSLDRVTLLELSHQSSDVNVRRSLTRNLIDRLRQMPGVDEVGAVNNGEFLTGGSQSAFFEPPPENKSVRQPGVWPVDAEFFRVLGIMPIQGRTFTGGEVAAAEPVLVISETVATAFFPKGGALGGVMKKFSDSFRVVGIVPDAQVGGLGYKMPGGQVYLAANALTNQRTTLLVRGRARVDDLLRAVASERIGVMRALPLAEALARPNRDPLFRVWLFSAFTIAALSIVAVGIFGIVAMSVGRRTRELGIRAALGATREALVALFVREQLITVAVGLVMGGALATWAVKFIKAYLFKTPPTDPWMWTIAALLLLLVAGSAAFIPSLGASRVDPVKALRAD